jgi:prophage regulatory protein
MTDKTSGNGRRPTPRGDGDRDAVRFISMKEVSRRVGFTPQHLRRLIAARAFPAYVSLGKNKIGFVEAEITAWQRARIAERDARRGKGDGEAGAQAPAPASWPVPGAGAGATAKV